MEDGGVTDAVGLLAVAVGSPLSDTTESGNVTKVKPLFFELSAAGAADRALYLSTLARPVLP